MGVRREVVEERRERMREVLEKLGRYAEELRGRFGKVSMLLFGSYARGDFNLWSDVDVIIVSEAFEGVREVVRGLKLPVFDPLPNIEAVCWTPSEAQKMLSKPSWREATRQSVVIVDDYGLFWAKTPDSPN